MSSCGDFVTNLMNDTFPPSLFTVIDGGEFDGCLRYTLSGMVADCTNTYLDVFGILSSDPANAEPMCRIIEGSEKHVTRLGGTLSANPGDTINAMFDLSSTIITTWKQDSGWLVAGLLSDYGPDWDAVDWDALGFSPGVSYWIDIYAGWGDDPPSVLDYGVEGNFLMFPQEIRDSFCFEISKCIGFFQGHLNCIEDVCSTYLNPPDVPPPPPPPPPPI